MRQSLSYLILLFLLIIIFTSFTQATFNWEQYGQFIIKFGYITADGNKDFYLDSYNYREGFNFDYLFDLSGRGYNEHSDLFYYFKKDHSQELDWEIYWDNPYLTLERGKEIMLDFPMLKIPFEKGRIDGIKLQAFDDNIIVFYGRESYIPVFFETTYMNTNKFSLFDPPSAGDILEFSEVVMVNGEMMSRGLDYNINYLSGELEFIIPLEPMADIQIKFLYIITNEELSEIKGKNLEGIFLSNNWVENNLNAYYFNKDCGINQVGGVLGRYSKGPFSMNGEMAISKFKDNDPALAYDLNFKYSQEHVDIDYSLRDITSDFHQIGVTKFPKGYRQQFEINQQLLDDLQFNLKLENYKKINNNRSIMTNLINGRIDYEFLPLQYWNIIFQKNDTQINEEKRYNTDIALGYVFNGERINISFGQFLHDKDSRFLKTRIKINNFHLNTDYNIKTTWDGKKHDFKLDFLLRPIDSLRISSLFHYERQFIDELGRYRLFLNGNWLINDNWSVNGSCNFFNSPQVEGFNQKYNLLVDYRSKNLNSNLTHNNSISETRSTRLDELETTISIDWILLDSYQLSYLCNQNYLEDYNKYENILQRVDKKTSHNVSLRYQFKNGWETYLNSEFYTNYYEYRSLPNMETKRTYGVGIYYQSGLSHLFNFATDFSHSDEYDIGFTGVLKYPLNKIKIGAEGKCQYSVTLNALKQYSYDFVITLPEFLKLIPQIGHKVEFTNQWPHSFYLFEEFSSTLRYHWTETSYLFLEYNWRRKDDWRRPEESYSANEISTGVEIIF